MFTRTKLPLLFPEHDFQVMRSYPEPGGTSGARERGTGIHQGERASAATRQGKLTVILKIDGSAGGALLAATESSRHTIVLDNFPRWSNISPHR